MSEIRDILRDMSTGRAIETGGVDRMEAADDLKDAKQPLEASMALLGNLIGTQTDFLKTKMYNIFNDYILETMLEVLIGIADGLNQLGLMSDRTFKGLEKGVDEIVDAIHGLGPAHGHPLGGDTVFANMFNMALKNDMPLQVPPQGGGGPIIPPAGP